MKIILDQPLCIHEMGSRAMQQDSVLPVLGEANAFDRLFMVGEGPLADVYTHKVSVNLHQKGVSLRRHGACRFYQIRPGFEEPLFSAVALAEQEEKLEISDVQSGDWFLLFTDGMCEYLNEEDLVSIFCRPDWTAEHKKDALLDYVSENEDNHSAYMLHVRAVEEENAIAAEEPKEAVAETPTKLKTVEIETDIQNTEVDLSSGNSVFDVSARVLLYILIAIYGVAMVYGFVKGLLG